MSKCARCDWHSDREDERPAAEQLADHSLDSSHPLCTVCLRSLPPAEGMACDGCLTTAREHLAGILLMFDELPTHLGHLRSPAYDSDRPSTSDGRPLPGGDVLVLLGPGSVGNLSRYGEDYEPDPAIDPERWWVLGRVGPLPRGEWNSAERVRYGKEHLIDNRPTDPVSVLQALQSWVMEWTETRGQEHTFKAGTIRRGVEDAAAFLEVHSRWAATSHDAFDEFATDMRDLHATLERATGRSERRIIAEADCFDCGGTLERLNTDTGYTDHWTCLQCGRIYTWQAYLLALRARLEEAS